MSTVVFTVTILIIDVNYCLRELTIQINTCNLTRQVLEMFSIGLSKVGE